MDIQYVDVEDVLASGSVVEGNQGWIDRQCLGRGDGE